jgi:hypothetical protein
MEQEVKLGQLEYDGYVGAEICILQYGHVLAAWTRQTYGMNTAKVAVGALLQDNANLVLEIRPVPGKTAWTSELIGSFNVNLASIARKRGKCYNGKVEKLIMFQLGPFNFMLEKMSPDAYKIVEARLASFDETSNPIHALLLSLPSRPLALYMQDWRSLFDKCMTGLTSELFNEMVDAAAAWRVALLQANDQDVKAIKKVIAACCKAYL